MVSQERTDDRNKPETALTDLSELEAGITDADPSDFEPGEYDSFLKPQPYKFDVPGQDDAIIVNRLSREDKFILSPDGDIDLNRERMPGNDVIRIKSPVGGKYGPVTPIQSPYEAKNDIKSLDWEDTHLSWNEARNRWEVDADSIGTVAEHLLGEGWSVAIDFEAAAAQLNPVVLKGDE